jgi:hypothetical protein
MSLSRQLTVLGGPESGKTTYLGALVDALQTRQLLELRLTSLEKDARGLVHLAEPLLEGKYPQRTKAERFELQARLEIVGDRFERAAFTLRLGDYDGEEVERLFKERIHGWSSEWQERSMSDGLLLLVRPSAIVEMPRLTPPPLEEQERWKALRHRPERSSRLAPALVSVTPLRAEQVFGDIPVDEMPAPPLAQPFTPVHVPTSLAMVELLQFIRHVRGLEPGERPTGERRFRIAVAVSAWDTVDPVWHRQGPAQYLAQHVPLLQEFLWSNFLPDDVFHFGLSATGGNLKDPEYRERYLESPSGFVEWLRAGEVQRSADLATPLYWLLFGDSAL